MSAPERHPPLTNKHLCHVNTQALSTTTEAREEVSWEACEEAHREYKRRHARRGGGGWAGR